MSKKATTAKSNLQEYRKADKERRQKKAEARRSPFKCKRCGRPLRTVAARRAGYGTICAKLQFAEDTHRQQVANLDQTNRYNPTLFQHEMPKFRYKIKGDVIIIQDEGGATAVLQNMQAVLHQLNQDNLTIDNAKHFLYLVRSPNGFYDGLIPDESAGRYANHAPKKFTLAPFAEKDEERAVKKLQLAWALGRDANPTL